MTLVPTHPIDLQLQELPKGIGVGHTELGKVILAHAHAFGRHRQTALTFPKHSCSWQEMSYLEPIKAGNSRGSSLDILVNRVPLAHEVPRGQIRLPGARGSWGCRVS